MSYISWIKSKWGQLDEAWRIAIIAFLVARSFYALWSWVILTIQPVAIHYIEVDGKTGITLYNLHNNQTFSYVSEVNGESLLFRAVDQSMVRDLQTGSLWSISTGTALEGVFQGTSLLPTETSPEMFPYLGTTPYPNAWLGLWQRFDTNWYLSIAQYGYGFFAGDHAFPPFFPLLIRLLTPITGHPFLAGLFIAHAATLYALKLLYDFFKELGGQEVARQTLSLVLLFPTAFFLFSAYTESLFLVFSLLALRCARTGAWHWSGFWIFLATLTRVQGLALAVPLVYCMWQAGQFLKRPQHWVGMTSAGAGFLFYLYFRSQYTAVAFPNVNSAWEPSWHWRFVPPWEGYFYAVRALASGNFNHIDFFNWLLTTVFLVLLITGWKKMPIEYNLYVTASLLIMLTRVIDTKPLNSMLRYLLTLFPIFFPLGTMIMKNPWKKRIIIYGSLALSLFLSAEFFGWGWVA